MKIIKIAIAFLLILSSFSFKISDEGVKECLIKEGETISFSSKPIIAGTVTYETMKRGSYDGTSFEYVIDSFNHVTIKKIFQAHGPKQDDFIFAGCTGSLTRKDDVLTVKLEKCRKGYYLVNLDKGILVAEFDTIIQVMLKSEKSVGKPAEYYCHQKDQDAVRMTRTIPAPGSTNTAENKPQNIIRPMRTIQLTAVPAGIKKDEMWLAKHPENTLAYFTKIEIETTGGEIKKFPQGSYILFEGDSFTLIE